MRRSRLPIGLLVTVVALALLVPGLARAQDGVFPLPAPLYILTSEGALLRVDPQDGTQTQISNPNQPVADFDIAPDGQWAVFRTANEGAVIVSQVAGRSGYVLEFDSVPPNPGPAQTIAWSPDAGALAYLVPGGVRIAYLGQGPGGEAAIGLVQGDWVELYWDDLDTLAVSDESGAVTRISGRYQQWTLEAAPDLPARPQPAVPSYLSADGVVIDSSTVVPRTAGTLAFDWGPLPPEPVSGYAMPADLYFLAPDAGGIDQVWRLPENGDPAQQLTRDVDPVTGYGISPDGARVAYIAGDTLIVQDAGGNLAQLAQLEIDIEQVTPRWSPDGTQIAYHDRRGVWRVLADGSQPPQIVAQSTPYTQGGNPGAVRFYTAPRWSPDASRLLVGVGLWESAILAVIDLGADTITELPHVVTDTGRWTGDGRVLAWSWYFAYSMPGLYLIDPAQPDATPTTLIADRPVLDVARGPGGGWYAVVSTPVQSGPRFLRVWQAASLDGDFSRVFPEQVGGFVSSSRLVTDGSQFIIAGVVPRSDEQRANLAGVLHLLDLGANVTRQVPHPAPVRAVQWAR